MSDTQRTDAKEISIFEEDGTVSKVPHVPTEFARELERELAEARTQIHILENRTAGINSVRGVRLVQRRAEKAEKELAEAQKESEGRRIQLGVCSIERTAEWKRAEKAESQVKVLVGLVESGLSLRKLASPNELKMFEDLAREILASIKEPT